MEQPDTLSQNPTISTGHSFNSALTSQSVQGPGSSTRYPNAPQPESNAGQVQQFLIEVFMINRHILLDEREAREAAEALATKLQVTGYGLYMLSKETLVGTLGAEGEIVYRILQDGQYGYYRKAAHDLFLRLYQRFLHLWSEEAAHINMVKQQKTEALQSHTYASASSLSSSPYTTSAPPKESSTLSASGQNESRYETRPLQAPYPLCPGKEPSDQLGNGIRNRHQFHLDID